MKLDTETGFLVDRETKVHFADDWYLKDFNGKTAGQGGPLVVSLIKAGAAIYAMTVNPVMGAGTAVPANKIDSKNFNAVGLRISSLPPPVLPPPVYMKTGWYIVCKDTVERDLAALANARTDVTRLEARVIAGDVSAPTQDLLTLRRSQVTDYEEKLTITAKATKPLTPASDYNGGYTGVSARIGEVDISPWFRLVSVSKQVARKEEGDANGPPAAPDLRELLRKQKLPGTYGYQVTIAVDKKLAPLFGCEGAGTGARVIACWADMKGGAAIATRDLTYTRPIPASAKIYPFAAACADGATCEPAKDWPEGEKASGTLAIKLPQLSRIYAMRTGGSIFGGRTVGAEFGSLGEPTMLQYNIGSSGKDAASVLDASVAAAQTARDADDAAIKRRLDATKNRKDLEALLEEQVSAPTP